MSERPIDGSGARRAVAAHRAGPHRDGLARREPDPRRDAGDGRLDEERELLARPYLLTGGRTRAVDSNVAMETIVVQADRFAVVRAGPLGKERATIMASCRGPRSVAELAARLDLPLTVAIVLVSDLVAERLLLASRTSERQAQDVGLIERLIAGVTAL